MHYAYILLSKKTHIFYYGSTKNVENRFIQHNSGMVKSTKAHTPWDLVWFAAFSTKTEAEDFENYLKTGSGKAFAYKRLVKVHLLQDIPFRSVTKL